MAGVFAIEEKRLIWRSGYETLWLEPWGKNSLRVRSSLHRINPNSLTALLEPQPNECSIAIGLKEAIIQNGLITAKLSGEGRVSFYQSKSGVELLSELSGALNTLSGRSYKDLHEDNFQIEARFMAYKGERIFGLGQHQHGLLDQKGCVLDLMQRNTEVTIPFYVSNRMYGFLWNNPTLGRVEFGKTTTRWVANSANQLDYFVTAGNSYHEIMAQYAAVTGYSPLLPEWAAGFWQSKLRYTNQAEVMEIAAEYRRRGLPLAGIIIDAYHWTRMGDMQFDPIHWHDPAGMVRELEEMGIKVMVSIWPHLNTASRNYPEMLERGYFVRTKRGVNGVNLFRDIESPHHIFFPLYDPSNPAARQYFWEQVREGYYSNGIKSWWLDACEPEITNFDYDNLVYYAGDGRQIGCMYPYLHQQTFYEGMKAVGEDEILLLSRSAWAGSQRWGTVVWSGDIPPTFESLRAQVTAGLNIGMSGIPWWTTDIGGFLGGNPDSSEYRELMVRWFQYGVFCPIFRLHGFREPYNETQAIGAPNEVWSFGEEAYEIISGLLHLRERLKPYLMGQMRLAHEQGIPPMRPMFFDFPDDSQCYGIDDQFLFGPDILIAPVLEANIRKRQVYLPTGVDWREVATDKVYSGGQSIEVDAPLERIPLFVRASTDIVL
ncbi:TIM-barrel domain-containing protein [Candidatus Chlorohelix sp.]|uniref:glycoside hydrolase family 31 protein n=1 Tax=Candidatus Chlorohelix sp. TaxID=3139201 RepID=UPI003062BF6F